MKVCTVLCLLCMGVTVLVVAPTTLSTRELARQIQDERARNIRDACEETNRRNARTVAAVDVLLDQTGASERRRREARARTLLLINEILPRQDCEQLVRARVQAGPRR